MSGGVSKGVKDIDFVKDQGRPIGCCLEEMLCTRWQEGGVALY